MFSWSMLYKVSTSISNREYYVFEGIRRISALKHLGWKEIDAIVADFSHLKTGRPPVYRKPRNYRNDDRRSNYGSDSRQYSQRPRRPSNIQTDERKKRY